MLSGAWRERDSKWFWSMVNQCWEVRRGKHSYVPIFLQPLFLSVTHMCNTKISGTLAYSLSSVRFFGKEAAVVFFLISSLSFFSLLTPYDPFFFPLLPRCLRVFTRFQICEMSLSLPWGEGTPTGSIFFMSSKHARNYFIFQWLKSLSALQLELEFLTKVWWGHSHTTKGW